MKRNLRQLKSIRWSRAVNPQVLLLLAEPVTFCNLRAAMQLMQEAPISARKPRSVLVKLRKHWQEMMRNASFHQCNGFVDGPSHNGWKCEQSSNH